MRWQQAIKDNELPASPDRSAFSRRLFLQVSAVGVSAGLVAGCWSGQSSDRAAAEIPDLATADIPAQHGRRVLVTGGNGYPKGFQGLRGLPGVASVPEAAQDRQSAATLWASLEQLGQVFLG